MSATVFETSLLPVGLTLLTDPHSHTESICIGETLRHQRVALSLYESLEMGKAVFPVVLVWIPAPAGEGLQAASTSFFEGPPPISPSLSTHP